MWKLLTQVFGSRNQRLIKELSRTVAATNALEPEIQGAQGRAISGEDAGAQGAFRRGHAARCAGPRGLRAGARGVAAQARAAPFRRAADRRPGAAPGEDRRDAHRRGQDADGDAARVPECAHGRRRARGHRERVPGAARLGLDGARCSASSASRSASSRTPSPRTRSAPPTPATSPTAPTTNSASITCATISRSVSRTACSASSPSRSSTRSTRS